MKNLGILIGCIALIVTCVGCSGDAGAAPPTAAVNGSTITNAVPKPGQDKTLAMKHAEAGARPALPGVPGASAAPGGATAH